MVFLHTFNIILDKFISNSAYLVSFSIIIIKRQKNYSRKYSLSIDSLKSLTKYYQISTSLNCKLYHINV